MTHDQFWHLIANSRSDFDPSRSDGNMALQAERMEQLLSALPAAEVVEFARIFTQLYFAAYRWDLWAAAYILGEGGCSDDGFMDFRYWLISMGRDVYEAAMADPQSLADVADQPGVETIWFEEFGYVADRVLELKGVAERSLPPGVEHPAKPAGERWEDEDLPRRFPRLWAKYGAAWD